MRYNLFCLLLSPLGWKLEDGRARPHTLSWLLCALKSHYAHASNSAFEALPSLHSDDLAKSSGARHLKMSQLVFLEKEAQISFKYLDIVTSTKGLKTLVCHDFFHFLRVGWFVCLFFLSINLYISPLLHCYIYVSSFGSGMPKYSSMGKLLEQIIKQEILFFNPLNRCLANQLNNLKLT